MGNGGSFTMGKTAGALTPGDKVKNVWHYTSAPAICLHSTKRDIIYKLQGKRKHFKTST